MHTYRADPLTNQKLVALDDLAAFREQFDLNGERVVLCHGVFDLLHPGHIVHLQQARALGSCLVVSVTADAYVRRGPGRPVFAEELRIQTLAALSCVDHVVLSEDVSALPVIDFLRPHIYCKGREYADPDIDITTNFQRERERVEQLGGEVRLLGGMVYSSTQLVNQHFDVLPEPARAFAEDFRTRYGSDDVRRIVDGLSELSVLVVGEVIVDEYISCDVQGVTLKERVPSVRQTGRERHWGGSYAIARHLAQLCGKVTLAGIAGEDEPIAAATAPIDAPENVERLFVTDPAVRTIVKQRYVHENKLRAELGKVFAVHHMYEPEAISPAARDRFRSLLREQMASHDLVVLTDYGHGLLDQATMDVLQEDAPLLALNCQTNSSNYGFNLVTKYGRADSLCLDQIELRLAFREAGSDNDELLLQQLCDQLGARAGWLTLGAAGAIGATAEGMLHRVPALTLHARDTLGAGDAFFAVASACASQGESLEVGSFLGSVSGALAVNITGNAKPVEKPDLVKFASAILNF